MKLFWIILIVVFSHNLLIGGEKIQANASPDAGIVPGESVSIPVNIDMTNSSQKLGNFTATLEWDPQGLHFEEYHGGTASGFGSPVVNSSEVEKGKLRFANAYPYGASDVVNILNVQFKVQKSLDAATSITMKFSAMGAARTFIDLLPYLDQRENKFQLELGGTEIPKRFQVGNFPNPFNPSTTFHYALPKQSHVKLKIFNVLGEEAVSLLDKDLPAGFYKVTWDASHFASGMYFYRFEAQGFVQTKKLLLLK